MLIVIPVLAKSIFVGGNDLEYHVSTKHAWRTDYLLWSGKSLIVIFWYVPRTLLGERAASTAHCTKTAFEGWCWVDEKGLWIIKHACLCTVYTTLQFRWLAGWQLGWEHPTWSQSFLPVRWLLSSWGLRRKEKLNWSCFISKYLYQGFGLRYWHCYSNFLDVVLLIRDLWLGTLMGVTMHLPKYSELIFYQKCTYLAEKRRKHSGIKETNCMSVLSQT